MSLINKEDLIAEYDRVHMGLPGGARKLMTEAEEIPAIPLEWIERYADWLTTIPAPFATNDEWAIRAMLAKWKTNPKLEMPEAGCGKDACDL
jgi:hypothetical protein